MNSLNSLIRAITPYGNNIGRITHLENIARAMVARDVPFGETADSVSVAAVNDTMVVNVDTTIWMSVGQRLQIENSGDSVYVEVASITDADTAVFRVKEIYGFNVGSIIPSSSKIVIGVPPSEKIGHVTSTVGNGWVNTNGTWSPTDTTATLTATFEGRSRSLTLNRHATSGVITVNAWASVENDIAVTQINGVGSWSLYVKFTDNVTGLVRDYTVYSIAPVQGVDGVDGADGADGVPILFQGDWIGTSAYFGSGSFKSSVLFNGGLFVAKQDSINVSPVTATTDAYWEYLGAASAPSGKISQKLTGVSIYPLLMSGSSSEGGAYGYVDSEVLYDSSSKLLKVPELSIGSISPTIQFKDTSLDATDGSMRYDGNGERFIFSNNIEAPVFKGVFDGAYKLTEDSSSALDRALVFTGGSGNQDLLSSATSNLKFNPSTGLLTASEMAIKSTSPILQLLDTSSDSTDGSMRYDGNSERFIFSAQTESELHVGDLRGKVFDGGTQIVGTQQTAISNPVLTSFAEADAKIIEILTALRNHGLIAT